MCSGKQEITHPECVICNVKCEKSVERAGNIAETIEQLWGGIWIQSGIMKS